MKNVVLFVVKLERQHKGESVVRMVPTHSMLTKQVSDVGQITADQIKKEAFLISIYFFLCQIDFLVLQ